MNPTSIYFGVMIPTEDIKEDRRRALDFRAELNGIGYEGRLAWAPEEMIIFLFDTVYQMKAAIAAARKVGYERPYLAPEIPPLYEDEIIRPPGHRNARRYKRGYH